MKIVEMLYTGHFEMSMTLQVMQPYLRSRLHISGVFSSSIMRIFLYYHTLTKYAPFFDYF